MKKMAKSVFLIAAMFGLTACSSNIANITKTDNQEFVLKESAVADARFGKSFGEVSLKTPSKKTLQPKRRIVLQSEDSSLVKPKIGTQVAYSDKNLDGINDHISIRYTAAISSLDVEATWTRAMYDADGNCFDHLLEGTYAVSKAYTGLTSNGVITYTTNEVDDFGNKPFNYYVVYSLFDVPLQSYGTYFLDASLQLSKGEESIVSKVGAVQVDNTSSFSYERGTNGDLNFDYDDQSHTYAVSGNNDEATEIVIPGYYNNGLGRYKVSELLTNAFKDYSLLQYIDIPSLNVVGADAFKNTIAKILSRDSEAGLNWDSEWNSGSNAVAWEYAGFHGEKDGLIYSLSKDELGRPYSTVIGSTNELEEDVAVSSFKGVATKKIGDYAFYGNETIKSITLPDSVIEIGSDAFRGSTIETIDTNKVVDIGDRAFYACKHLNDGIICGSSLRTIGNYCFAFSTIKKLILNDGFESLGDSAFYTAFDGETCKLFVPSSIRYLGYSLFNGASGTIFLESPEIEDVVGTNYRTGGNETVICGTSDMELHVSNGFSYYEATRNGVAYATIINIEVEQGATSLTIPEQINGATVEDIKDACIFTYNGETIDEVIVEARLTHLKTSMFQGLRAKSIVLPDSIITIDLWAFAWSNLETIRIPNSVISINSAAFSYCDFLERVYLPSSIQTMGYDLFEASSKVKVYCEDASNKWGDDWNTSEAPVIWDYLNAVSEELRYGDYLYSLDGDNAIIVGYVGNNCDISIPAIIDGHSVTKIGDLAFYGNETIKSITLPDSVIEIGSDAFRGSTIETIDTNKVVDIGDRAFYACKHLNDGIICGSSLRTIGNYCFAFSTIKKLILNDGFESLGDSAFYTAFDGETCKLFVPSSIRYLGYSLFNGASGTIFLESPEIEDVVGTNYRTGGNETVICGTSDMELHVSNGFSYYEATRNGVAYATIINIEVEQGATSLTIPEQINGATVEDIKDACIFTYNGETIDEVIVEARLTHLKTSMFQGLRAKSIVLPDSIITIDLWAFAWSNLETIRIPNSVISINSAAFSYCDFLERVYLPSSIQTMGYDLFEASSKVKVYCEDASNKWGDDWNTSAVPVYWNVSSAAFDALGD